MKGKSLSLGAVGLFIAVVLSLPLYAMAQQEGEAQGKTLSQQELAQLLAPIALYPDDLVAQILMASTYPLEVVQADRWVQQNKSLKGDALAKALEKQNWDPSVKSMVNFPSVLSAMSQKLEVTTSVGDAYLAQPKDVMEAIQELRSKAQSAGNLKTTKEQQVVVEQQTIVIKQADPQVVYVPSYSPTVVYGTWPYPAYPPYSYYPPPPPAYPAYHFAAGVAVGLAWGYAWGNCNWHGGSVDYNVNQNIIINKNIDRSRYKGGGQGQGRWQHNPAHRKNVAYRDGATSRRYGQSPAQATQRRAQARGYGDRAGGGAGARPAAGTMDRGGRGGAGPAAGTMDRGGRGGAGTASRAGSGATFASARDSAFSGASRSGSQERMASQRGQASRQSPGARSFGGGASRAGGGFGGGGGGGRRR